MLGKPNTALSQIHMQIMWSRLIAVVEEQAQTLVRTAFSTTAISRLHMICMWIWDTAVLGLPSIGLSL